MNIQFDQPALRAALEAKELVTAGPVVEEHEAIARHGLPILSSVEAATSDAERLHAYSVLIARQRAQFIAMYGDPQGRSAHATTTVFTPMQTVKKPLPSMALSVA